MHFEVKISKDERKKPHVNCFYDHTKGVLKSSLSTRIKCKRWPINCLAFLLVTVRTNAKTILQENGTKLSNFE